MTCQACGTELDTKGKPITPDPPQWWCNHSKRMQKLYGTLYYFDTEGAAQ